MELEYCEHVRNLEFVILYFLLLTWPSLRRTLKTLQALCHSADLLPNNFHIQNNVRKSHYNYIYIKKNTKKNKKKKQEVHHAQETERRQLGELFWNR
jgi:hypothetical protein